LGTAVINDLSDVVVTSPLQFQGLMYDGTNWVNSNIPNTYLVRNNTGSTLLKGTLVGAVGAEPSGRIDVAPFEVTGLQDSELRAMGIVVNNISNGSNGEVISFGTLTGLDTRGSTASSLAVGDETWAAGDVLFAHPTVDGKLTNVRPQHDLPVAFITVRHASTGQIAVRIVSGNNHLEWMHDVSITSPQDKDALVYDSAQLLWRNQQVIPAGSVQMFAGSTVPAGWLLCNGAPVSRTGVNAALFAAIGVTYGAGDGSTTFNLPDMRSRMPIGAGTGTGLTNRTLGTAGGGETKTINSANLPTHTHAIDHDHPNTGSFNTSIWHQHGIGFSFFGVAPGGTVIARPDGNNPLTYASVASDPVHAHNTDLGNLTGSSGNGGFANTPLDVVNPFLSVNFIIKV
jgi:microcystin-dependent protein